ncbi:MAG: cation:proton antiporter [Minisyncoccia bacterium]
MELFAEISILIAIATGMAMVMRLVHQPLIIGHILTGLLVGPFFLNIVQSTETLALMGEIGVAILLFTVGLHLSPAIIRQFGRVSFLTGFGQVVITSIAGYILCIFLGFAPLVAFYIAVALSFSSTIIIMKLITDKGDLEVLYAKIAIGFLLVQDLIAVLLLVGIPLFFAEDTAPGSILKLVALGVGLVAFIALTARFFLSRVSSYIESSQEFLFLFAISWGIGIAALFREFGFSLESGALIAGVALASLPSRLEISARLTPLRDFFIVIFFIYLGAQLQLGDIASMLPIAFALSALVLIGNPLILMSILGLLGYRKKTSLQTGFTVAQISEFSLILVALGVSLGHIDRSILSLVTLVGIITIFGSTYLVLYSDRIYKRCAPFLSIFERQGAREPRARRESYEIVLFGCNRIGYDFVETLIRMDARFLVVDYDPDTVASLEKAGVASAFGDASNLTFLESLDFSKATLVISTIPDPEVNALIQHATRASNPKATVIVVAHRIQDALDHYDDGIDYVILPHFLGAKHAADLVHKFKGDRTHYETLREDHIEHLRLRAAIGHDHPTK